MPTAASAETTILRNIPRYFAHGLAFNILFLIVGFVWSAIFLILVICGFIIGLIIGLVLYFVFMGYVNSFVTEALWFPVRTGFLACLGHGLLLALALLPITLVLFGVQLVVQPDILTILLLYVALSPFAGAIAKAVARIWEVPQVELVTQSPPFADDSGPPPFEPPWK